MTSVIGRLVLGCLLVASQAGASQDQGVAVSLIQLIASPDKFDGKVVTVHGFLRMGAEKHHSTEAILYLHQEDAKHLLGSNAAVVIPSEKMLRDQEKIDRMYVAITGVVRVFQAANGSQGMVIRDVQTCREWSDPRRPIGQKNEEESRETDKK